MTGTRVLDQSTGGVGEGDGLAGPVAAVVAADSNSARVQSRTTARSPREATIAGAVVIDPSARRI